jgi:hypothetical protein
MTPPVASIASVHRYPSRAQRSGASLAGLYWAWLDRAWGPLVRVNAGVDEVNIRLLGLSAIVLRARGAGDYAVQGGLLARPGGRFQFRSTEAHAEAALEEFRPTLPTWLYRSTHGVAHEWTMRRFGRHLARLDTTLEEPRA